MSDGGLIGRAAIVTGIVTNTKSIAANFTVAALALFAAAAVSETPVSQLSKWHLNTGKSDQGRNPNPVVEAVLDITADDGKTFRFTLVKNLKDGSKLSYKWDSAPMTALFAQQRISTVSATNTLRTAGATTGR